MPNPPERMKIDPSGSCPKCGEYHAGTSAFCNCNNPPERVCPECKGKSGQYRIFGGESFSISCSTCDNAAGKESPWTREAPKEDCLIHFVDKWNNMCVGKVLLKLAARPVVYLLTEGERHRVVSHIYIDFEDITHWSRHPIQFPPAPEDTRKETP